MESLWKGASIVAGLCSVAAWAAHAQTSRFDCAKARTRTEKAICADRDLAKLDKDLSTTYAVALKANPGAKESQRVWLKSVDVACTDVDQGGLKHCIQWAFQGRASILEALAAGSAAAPVTIGNMAISVNNDDRLCRSLVVDEAKLSDKPGYERQPGDSGETTGRLSDPVLLRGHMVSLRNVGSALSEFKETRGGSPATEMQNFSNAGRTEIVYRVAGGNHYFNGNLFIVTDTDVPRDDVIKLIDDAQSPSGGVDGLGGAAVSRGWNAFTGGETPYKDVRYASLYPFRFEGTTYLLVEPIPDAAKPVAILAKPSRPNIMTTVCVFEQLTK